jgi:phage-related minor tail protein
MIVRSRDLRSNIKEWGFEKGVVITVEQMLDEFAGYRQHMRELTDLVAKCVDQIERFITIGDGLRADIDRIKREGKHDDDRNGTDG